MSFSLTVSGHVEGDQAERVDEIVREGGRSIVAALAELGVVPTYAAASGPSGFEDFLIVVEPDPAADSAGEWVDPVPDADHPGLAPDVDPEPEVAETVEPEAS